MTPDIQFLIKCCKSNLSVADIGQICTHINQLDNQQLTQIVDLSHTHRVFPIFYQVIQAHTKKLLSNEYHAELKQQYMTNIMKNMRMTAELVRIMKLLEENGIEALAFKGPTLAKIAYGDMSYKLALVSNNLILLFLSYNLNCWGENLSQISNFSGI